MTGVEIRRLRQAHGYTQTEFARLIGCTPGDVSRFENGHKVPGRRVMRQLNALADPFKLDSPVLQRLASLCNAVSDGPNRIVIQQGPIIWIEPDKESFPAADEASVWFIERLEEVLAK